MKLQQSRDGIALYHVVWAHEDFDQTASKLLQLIRKAQQNYPGQKRSLYLDIEGHRNANGAFDSDMFELQSKFATEFLSQFLGLIVMPLATIKNPLPQSDDIPARLNVISLDGKPGEDSPDAGGCNP